MSEENNNCEKNKQDVSIGFAHVGNRIEIEFADGKFVIPDRAVAMLGGAEKLLQIAHLLKQKTIGEFMSGIGLLEQKQKLNQFQQNIISNHFGQMF